MNIALDYDGTFTLDPKLWLMFITTVKQRGHDIKIVTMRYAHEIITMDHDLLKSGIDIIFTDRTAKRPFAKSVGFDPDIWIDDMPEFILGDAG